MVNVDPMMDESTVSHEYKSNERVRGYKDKSCKSNDKFYDVRLTKMTNLISFAIWHIFYHSVSATSF